MIKQFSPVAWAHNTNIYEVNLRQYSQEGTINAFSKELPRLKEMGVETLWFMPLTPIATKEMKGTMGSYYACADYTSVNSEFGTLNDFTNLVAEAHAMGFKVILDWVANHTGWDHRWTTEHPDYFLIDQATNNFKMASGMEDIIELDYHNPALRKAMIDAMQFWVTECNIDGFRCDLASWVVLDFWIEARKVLDAVKPLFWLGEFDELDTPTYGEAFDASYSWNWMHKTKAFYQEKLPLEALLSLLKRYDDIGDSSMRAWFTTNHDENSWNGTEYEKYGGMAKALAVFSATWNGIPLLYSGQELPNLKRLQFFDKDPIEWTSDYKLQEFYRILLDLHRTNKALRAGDPLSQTFMINSNHSDKVLIYLRKHENNEVLVVLNMSEHKIEDLSLPDEKLTGIFKNVFAEGELDFNRFDFIELEAWDYGVFEKQ